MRGGIDKVKEGVSERQCTWALFVLYVKSGSVADVKPIDDAFLHLVV